MNESDVAQSAQIWIVGKWQLYWSPKKMGGCFCNLQLEMLHELLQTQLTQLSKSTGSRDPEFSCSLLAVVSSSCRLVGQPMNPYGSLGKSQGTTSDGAYAYLTLMSALHERHAPHHYQGVCKQALAGRLVVHGA